MRDPPCSSNRSLVPSPGPERQTSVVATKSEGVGESDPHRAFHDAAGAIVQIAIRIRIGQVDRGRHSALLAYQSRYDRLDAASRAQQVPRHRFRGTHDHRIRRIPSGPA